MVKFLLSLMIFTSMATAFAEDAEFELLPSTKECRSALADYDKAVSSYKDADTVLEKSDLVCANCLSNLSDFGHEVMIDVQTSYDDGRTELIHTIKKFLGKKLPIKSILASHMYPGFPGETETYRQLIQLQTQQN